MYSFDLAYLEYFRCAAEGHYSRHFVKDRLTLLGIACFTLVTGFFRLLLSLIHFNLEIVKVFFYVILTTLTLGSFENYKRLVAHIKLLFLSALRLATHSAQFVIHALSIIIGFLSPFLAYRMMQVIANSLAWISSKERQIWQIYPTTSLDAKIAELLKSKLTKNFDYSSRPIEVAMKTLINEFSHAMDSGIVAPLGLMDNFHLFGANPLKLTEEQKRLEPILLLNGNYSHQACFLPLLYKLSKSGNKRPIFTLNLPPNCRDIHLILNKVELIKKQYDKVDDLFFNIDLIGHSNGADLVQILLQTRKVFFINRIITLGTPCYIEDQFNNKKIFDITAKNDPLILEKSCLVHSSNRVEVDTGHLGLLFHAKSLNAVQHFLNA